MKKQNKQRSSITKTKKVFGRGDWKVNGNLVLKYLQGDREEALQNIAKSLRNYNFNEIKPILKQSIYQFVKNDRKDFDGEIYFQECACQLFGAFKDARFIDRKWQYYPFFLRDKDYFQLQTCSKFPVLIKNYDTSEPIYALNNNFYFNNREKKGLNQYTEEKIKNDVQFFLSKESDILCAKLITLKYQPIKEKLSVRKKLYRDVEKYAISNGLTPQETKAKQKELVEHQEIYKRSLSLSMYVLLNGDPNKAMPFIRYDNEEEEHNNIYIGDDKRRAVFGDKANGPHFHFQNETDSLLCLKKYQGADAWKYKTGRCNAIDIPHLRKYLIELDSLSQKEVLNMHDKQLHYGMPFLEFKLKNKGTNININGQIHQFFNEKSAEGIAKISYINDWIEKSKENDDYKNTDGKKFGKLIKALDFISFINDKRKNSRNLAEKKMLTELEVISANELIKTFSSCQANELSSNRERYQIEGSYLTPSQKQELIDELDGGEDFLG